MSATIGINQENGTPVLLEDRARRRGLYMIGKNGTGKTTLLLNLLLQDIGCCFIDPHGDATDDLLTRIPAEHLQRVVLLDAGDRDYSFGVNLFQVDDPSDHIVVARRAEQAVSLFRKLWGEGEGASWGPRLEDLLANVAYTLIYNPGMSMADISIMLDPAETAVRARLARSVHNEEIRAFWRRYERLSLNDKEIWTAPLLNKVRPFTRHPLIRRIVGQPETTVRIRDAMDGGQIVLLKLQRSVLGDQAANLIGSIVIGLLLNAALSRADTPAAERRPFHLYADEYHRFATPDFADLIDEARKYLVATTIAHQRRSQLDHEHRAAPLNAVNIVVFGINGEDAEELKTNFNAKPQRELVGQVPRKVVSLQPVDDLIRSPHANPDVQALVRDFLVHLVEDSKNQLPREKTAFYTYDRQRYHVGSMSLRTALLDLNAFLGRMMRGEITPGTVAEASAVAHLLERLRSYIGLHNEIQYAPVNPGSDFSGNDAEWSLKEDVLSDDVRESLVDMVHLLVTCDFSDQWAGLSVISLVVQAARAEGAARIFQKIEQRDRLVFFDTARTEQFLEEPFVHYSALPHQESNHLFAQWCQLSIEEQNALVTPKAQQAIDKFESRDEHARHIAQQFKRYFFQSPRPFLLPWCQRFLWWTEHLTQLGRLLQDEPILINSTDTEPQYRDRPIADIRNELANTMANLDDYIAYCKLRQGEETREYTVRTLPLAPARATTEGVMAQLAERREQYCRKSDWVDEQLRRQHADSDDGVIDGPPPRAQ